MKRIKMVGIVWVAIYPTILMLQYFFGEMLGQLPLWLRSLVLTGILVPLMVYVLIPFWTKVFNLVQNRVLGGGSVSD